MSLSPPSSPHAAEDPTMSRLLPPPNLVPLFAHALESYRLSNASFRVLCSLPPAGGRGGGGGGGGGGDVLTLPPPPRRPPRSILVLDSSFNPPTLAHQRMALSALAGPGYHHHHHHSPAPAGAKRSQVILLLLAINNADKAPKPAAFPQRLAMMYMFARDLLSAASASARDRDRQDRVRDGAVVVDIGVTTEPYFHAKSGAIASADFYRGVGAEAVAERVLPPPQQRSQTQTLGEEATATAEEGETEQVYLTGFDTLVRIFDPKYYPGGSMRAALDPLFARARLRVTARPDAGAGWGDAAAQRRYLAGLRDPIIDENDGGGGGGRETTSRLEQVGGRTEWADRVEMVEDEDEEREGKEAEVVSSTRVRDAVRARDWEVLERMVSPGVAAWIRENGVYGEAGAGEG